MTSLAKNCNARTVRSACLYMQRLTDSRVYVRSVNIAGTEDMLRNGTVTHCIPCLPSRAWGLRLEALETKKTLRKGDMRFRESLELISRGEGERTTLTCDITCMAHRIFEPSKAMRRCRSCDTALRRGSQGVCNRLYSTAAYLSQRAATYSPENFQLAPSQAHDDTPSAQYTLRPRVVFASSCSMLLLSAEVKSLESDSNTCRSLPNPVQGLCATTRCNARIYVTDRRLMSREECFQLEIQPNSGTGQTGLPRASIGCGRHDVRHACQY